MFSLFRSGSGQRGKRPEFPWTHDTPFVRREATGAGVAAAAALLLGFLKRVLFYHITLCSSRQRSLLYCVVPRGNDR